MKSQGGGPRPGDSGGASHPHGDYDGPQGPPGGPGQSQGYGQPQDPYAAGAPLTQPASHLVEVKAGVKYTALQLAGPLLCLSIGGAAVGTAIPKREVEDRRCASCAGSCGVMLGL